MTREEAIEYLETLYMALAVFPNQQILLGDADKMKESVGMAIESLEQEPCEDAISRQAVLEQINCWISSGEYGYTNATHYLTRRMQELPSVTPQYTDAEIQKMQELEQSEIEKAYELGKSSQPKKGRWINVNTGNPIYVVDGMTNASVKCSECDEWLIASDEYACNGNYCPNCGAKMESEVSDADSD